MKQISHNDTISNFLQDTDTKVKATDLEMSYEGVVSEVTVNGEFDGTLIYFPGVRLKKLKGDDL